MNSTTDSATIEGLLPQLERMRAQQLAEGMPSLALRKENLQKCIDLLVDNQHALAEALNNDYGGRSPYLTRMSEVLQTIAHFKHALKNVGKWMKDEKRSAPFPMGLFGAKAHIRYQPKGVVGIMSPWNFPIAMIMNPLCNALAAGNRVMVKPSEFNPQTADLMKSLLGQYFSEDVVYVAVGGPEVGSAFASLPLNHILFTGATGIGKKIMQAAAENLTPVTLELGGKSPVIIGRSADILDVSERIATGKSNNAGQVCLSPDYVFVPEESLETFIDKARETFQAQYPTVANNADYTAMINERHHQRISNYLDEARAAGVRVENLAANAAEVDDVRIPIHIVVEPGEDLAVMQEEIFGPILIVKPYRDLDSCLAFINARPTPLGLYYFGKDAAEQAHVLDNTLSGGVTINEVIMHVACVDMPFGGVGNSGVGNYHGREGFKTFSHARSVFKEGRMNLAKLGGALPPYGEKLDKMLDSQIKR